MEGYHNFTERVDEVDPLEDFKAEIAILKDREKMGLDKSVHLTDIDLDKLTEDDARMWNRVKHFHDNPVNREELTEYENKVIASEDRSRLDFKAFVANKLAPRFVEQALKQEK